MILLEKNCKVTDAKDLELNDYILTENGYKKIISINQKGTGNCYDITLLKEHGLFKNEPNFILSNGIVSHNCNLPIIDDCVRLIKENKGITLKRQDIPIDDKDSIRLGTKGDLFGIFQFENPYTKKISDKVGVDCLGDIAAITSLIRPGPKDVGLDIEYAARKNGKKFEKNPVFDKVLGNTYSVLTYQEQVNLLGIHMAGLSPLEANRLRKGASKKKIEIMNELKPKFIAGSIEKCVKTGIMTEEQVHETWNMIESTASYSFNKCLSPLTLIEKNEKTFVFLKDLKLGDKIRAYSKKGDVFATVTDIIQSGIKPVWKFTCWSGNVIICTMEHKFLTCVDGKYLTLPIKEICENNYAICKMDNGATRIAKKEFIGNEETMDITIDTPEHLFYANKLITSNSHAIAYSAITTSELWLRHHYFCEYMTALLQNEDPASKKFGETMFDKYIKYAISGGVKVHKPDVNLSGERFRLKGSDLWFGMGHIKNVSSSAKSIEEHQPYSGMEDFYERCKVKVGELNKERRPNSRVVESLIYAGAFDRFGTREAMMKKYYEISGKVEKTKLPKIYSDVKSYIIPDLEEDVQNWKTPKPKAVFVNKYKEAVGIYEPLIKLESDNGIKYLDLPPLDDKTLQEKEAELLGVLFSENLAIKCREVAAKHGVFTLRSAKHQEDLTKIRILGKINKITECTSKSGNNYLKVLVSDGLWDYKFNVWSYAINDFMFRFQEGDIAIIPLKNRGKGEDNPNDRFYDDKGNGKIIERDGILQDE